MAPLDSLRLKITFKDRKGFVFDVSKVILDWALNIISIEITSDCLYLQIEEIAPHALALLLDQLKTISGLLEIRQVSTMPAEEKEKKIRAVLDAVSEGIVAVDVDGVITNANPVAEKILQRPADELLGKNIAQILSVNAPILRCLRDGKPYNYREVSMETYKGRLNFVTTGRPLKDDRGNIIGAVAIITDMSDVKQFVYSMTKPVMTTFDDIIGSSPVFVKVLEFARAVAKGDTTVLIRGESGTGKELFARAIHMGSRRQGKPFVPINCAALPENLLESELFGYVEGAFTGAQKGGKVGLFEFANNGTLFLDEIGELSTHLQAKLLRVLQEGRVRRIGDRVENIIHVRVVAASNRNLEEMVRNGDFREDLYYRLNVVPLYIPPLRQRQDDIRIIAEHLIAKFNIRESKTTTIAGEAIVKLSHYPWPGNIRELENVLERATILAEGREIEPEHIHFDPSYSSLKEIGGIMTDHPSDSGTTLEAVVSDIEKQYIAKALHTYGSIRQTAKALGVSHTTIMNKMKKYDLTL